MSYSDSGNAWRNDGAMQPHAYDPYLHPELFRGVATRRAFAFLIDMVVIAVPVVLGYLFILLFGLLTLGIGWRCSGWPGRPRWSGPSSITAPPSAGRIRRRLACA